MNGRPKLRQIRNAFIPSLSDESGSLVTISIDELGYIASISPSSPGDPSPTLPPDTIYDAKGHLVVPSFAEPHLHLDKALILSRTPTRSGTFAEALERTAEARANFTVEDTLARARRALKRAVVCGVTHARSFVEVDTKVGLSLLTALHQLYTEVHPHTVDLQLAAFAQDGITNLPGTETLLRNAVDRNNPTRAHLVASAPYTDPDPIRNADIVLDIAQEVGCDVDFHLDFLDRGKPWASDGDTPGNTLMLPYIARSTIARSLQHRVTVGHCAALSDLAPHDLAEVARLVSEAGVNVVALPGTDMYMWGRRDLEVAGGTRRGVAPLDRMAGQGCGCAVSSNNLQNLFSPLTDFDPLKTASLTCTALHLTSPSASHLALEFTTTRARQCMGLRPPGPELASVASAFQPGEPADFVVLMGPLSDGEAEAETGEEGEVIQGRHLRSLHEAMCYADVERMVIKAGKLVVETRKQRLWS
ncbi:Metallo-dependent hydrolase [Gonapodya prolifera JEL478]|uniref:Metallo-dependent hydrolase n=1 Tax=Gonapodya prolifera (strain JEL478) TaxID=1344416 RepID=A0A139AS43_GONPJ|nr:Metallo-dependent hydrolase [Gonapodya prolifera JEL478]|eukprot:KXS19464.1 Metallo-dependent hydrolase [Gonapodya prolifera JEL478]